MSTFEMPSADNTINFIVTTNEAGIPLSGGRMIKGLYIKPGENIDVYSESEGQMLRATPVLFCKDDPSGPRVAIEYMVGGRTKKVSILDLQKWNQNRLRFLFEK